MLATLALVATIGHQPQNQDYIIRRSFDNFDSQSFHVHKEQVPDPNDPSKTVEAEVSYFIAYEIHEEEEPDDYEFFRNVRTRPESPAQSFQMSRMRVRLDQGEDSTAAMRAFSRTLAGAGIPRTAAPTVSRSLQAIRQEAAGSSWQEETIQINPNLNLRAGGWTEREYGYEIWVTDLHMQLKKRVAIPGRDPVVSNVGDEVIVDLWEYWDPIPMRRERFTPDPANDQRSSFTIPENIGGVKFNEQYADLTGITYVPFPRLRLNEYAIGKNNLLGSISASTYTDRVFSTLPQNRQQVLDVLKLSPSGVTDLLNMHAGQGTDMNSLRVPGDMRALQGPNCGSEMVAPPGTCWIPDRAGYQTMSNTVPLRLRYDFDASIDGGSIMQTSLRTHCLNKDLKEPEAGVRYFPFMSNDDVISGLMDLTSKSNFRGPWDQVRTWIYTDKVGLTEANERIFPPIAEGQYANGLYDVFRLGGLNKTDLTTAKLFEPILLASAGTSDDAFGWLSMHMGEKFGKEVRSWLNKMPDYLTKMVTAPQNDSEKTHPKRLLTSLLNSLNVDSRIAALEFLDKFPQGEKWLKGQLGDFSMLLDSVNKVESDLAKKVVDRYITPDSDSFWQPTR